MPENHFGEAVAARYDESSSEMFEPAAVEPVVDFLAALAGPGAALELGIGRDASRCRSLRAVFASTGSISPRRWSRGCGPSPAVGRST
jgi:hypothetical protein